MNKHVVCPWWLAFTFDNPLRRLLHDPEKILSGLVKPGMTVADIGCGMGYFSIAMARMVGPSGKVLSLDIQQEMLDHLMKRARRQAVPDVIETRLIPDDNITINRPVDFVLAFWMVHETGDIPRFLGQVSSVLKPGGSMMIAEPRMHVSARTFRQELQFARDAGFQVSAGPKTGWSNTAVLTRA
jgi:cyclopropane fatty-acyl-phospholipid synthase-like methyltransferase